MNVNGIDATSTIQQTGAGNSARQDFKTLAQALQSGDLSGAQQAFAALQQDAPWISKALSSTGAATGPASSA
ncbi:MAG TPA: hypothetical protein VMV45_11500, partial [Casimicrobiaceae bacterium]|nr:hypothetical protein [Casimicrobiaceae bacterium]